MRIAPLPTGRYIIAVSGGVDSVVLFDMVRNMPGVELVVAHVDHGMRAESQQDREFVQHLARSHNIPFVYEVLKLGFGASEANARKARYNFLQQICIKYNATAMLMAHHGDDRLETALINAARGTGWRGLVSLRSHSQLIRPLLQVPKSAIIAYAREHNLAWREDRTNTDQKYLRNYLRHAVLPKLSASQRQSLTHILDRQEDLRHQIDDELDGLVKQYACRTKTGIRLERHALIMLPVSVAAELLQRAIKHQAGNTVLYVHAMHALHFARTARLHKTFPLGTDWRLRVDRGAVIVEPSTS